MERISGPVNGFYIATYACPVGEFGTQYLGHARICSVQPRSFWEAIPIADLVATEWDGSSDAAHTRALVLATSEVHHCPAERGWRLSRRIENAAVLDES